MDKSEHIIKLMELERESLDARARPETHIAADKVLCDVLTQLGHADIVSAYKRIAKWYE